MDDFEENAKQVLDGLRNFITRQTGGCDDGTCREILLDYASSSTNDVYTVVQDHNDFERGVPVQCSPTLSEWNDFGRFMERLHRMDTEKVGVALVTLPVDTPGLGLTPDTTEYTLNGKRFEIKVHPDNSDYFKSTVIRDGAFYLSSLKTRQEPYFRTTVQVRPDVIPDSLATEKWVEKFERLIRNSKAFASPVYAAEKDVDTQERRNAYQLPPESCIYPRPKNRLDSTSHKIGGIHTPWLYVSCGFGTPFTLHKEDTDASALNVLHAGMPKCWTTIAPHHARKLENVIAEALHIKAAGRVCDNWVRELGIYIPQQTLEKHKIHYCLFLQAQDQVVITFTQLYHQGYNTGINGAEAVNFGDKYWSPTQAKFCASMKCSHQGSLQETQWEPIAQGDQQISVGIREFFEAEEDVPSKVAKKSSADCASSRTRAAHPSNQRESQKGARIRNGLRSQEKALPRSTKVGRPHQSRSLRPMFSTTVFNPPVPLLHIQDGAASTDNTHTKTHPVSQIDHYVDEHAHSPQSCLPQDSPSQQWEKLDARYQSSKFKPSVLAQDLQKEKIFGGKTLRTLSAAEVTVVTAIVIAFGSVDVFVQLKDAFPTWKYPAKDTQCCNLGSAASFVRMLDIRDGDAYSLSVRERLYLAKFTESVNKQLNGERQAMGVKMKTQVYEKIMKEVYPKVKHPKDGPQNENEWNRKYRALEERYANGKRWLMVAEDISWHSLLLLPSDGTLHYQHRKFYKLPNEVFNLLMAHLKRHKKEFLGKVCRELDQAIKISSAGKLSFTKRRLRLESTSIDEINSCPEMSEKLCELAQII